MSIAFCTRFNYPTAEEREYRRGETRRLLLGLIALKPARLKQLTNSLPVDVEPTYSTVSAAMYALADDGEVIHLEDGCWALWGSEEGVKQQLINTLRNKLKVHGNGYALPMSTASLVRQTGLERRVILGHLFELSEAGQVKSDQRHNASWWVETSLVDVIIKDTQAAVTLYIPGGEIMGHRTFRFSSGHYRHNQGRDRWLTLESAVCSMI